MPLQLVPAIEPRERILVYGNEGTGKSTAVLEVARLCPNNRFWVVDNDFSYRRLLATSFQDLGNVTVAQVDVVASGTDPWDASLETLARFRADCAWDDWVVIDSLTPMWEMCQGWYTNRIYGAGMDEYFLMKREALQGRREKSAKESGGALGLFEQNTDWPVINKQYAKLNNMILNSPCHVFATAEQVKVRPDDDKGVRGMFGDMGVKPGGQKRTGYVFSTVLWLNKRGSGEYEMTTIKDRGREDVTDRAMGNFARDYLVNVAGWRRVRA